VNGPSLQALVIADEPVPGVAERVAAEADDDDETAGERLRASLAADGISLPAGRGLPDLARRIIARLRGQQLVDDLGEVDGTFEMFGLHVPPAGRAALELSRSATSERQVSVTAMGLGFGGGRKLTLAIDEDIPERGGCMRVLQHVLVRVRRYATPGEPAAEPLVMTDVVAWGRREMAALPDCAYCGTPGDELNPFEFDEDTPNALDLRAFDTPVTRRTEVTLEGSRKADIGVDLALAAGGKIGAGFHLEQQTTISCTASYTFPAGRWFLPYRRRGETATLPYWAVR
jgi:hypothetical protein